MGDLEILKSDGSNIKNHFLEFYRYHLENSPDKTAVIDRGIRYSYKQIDEQTNSISNFLLSKGAKPQDVIGLCVENEIKLIVCLLAIWKINAIYLPLDPTYPKERLEFMLKDANASFILLNLEKSHIFSNISTHFLYLDEISEASLKLAISYNVDKDSWAYIIYTSGSTGRPKGIIASVQSLSNIALAHRDYYPEKLIALMSGAISFDVSILLIVYMLANGNTLCLLKQEYNVCVEKVLETIQMYSVNFIISVPSFYNILLSQRPDFSQLTCVSLTGEVLPDQLCKLHAKYAYNAYLYNEYGPSEYAIGTTIAKIFDPIEKRIYPITVGKPLPYAQVVILDEHLNVLSENLKGEIYIGGLGLAIGYLNQEELTRTKFVRINLDGGITPCLYKSGDFGRILANGNLEFLGRIDHQVKVRGHRIELEEIEHIVRQFPEITQVAVIPVGEGNDIRLSIFFTSESKENLIYELQLFLKKTLTKHMMPENIFQLKELPLNPNGKIDRHLLLKIEEEQTKNINSCSIVNDSVNLEDILLTIWKDVLKNESIFKDDNFFDLGGDSFSAINVQQQIEVKLQIPFTVIEFFQNQTINKLIKHLSKKLRLDQEGGCEIFQNKPVATLGFQKFRNFQVKKREVEDVDVSL